MTPKTTYRIVAVRTDDGTRRILCDNLGSEMVARQIASNLKDCIPFATVIVEAEDAPDGQLSL